MSFTKSSNPAFTDKIFAKASSAAYEDVMTVSGTLNKIAMMLLLVVASASYTWGMYFDSAQTGGLSTAIMPWMIGGGVDSSMESAESLYLTTPNTPCRSL